MRVFFTELMEITVEFQSPVYFRGQYVSSTLNLISRPLSFVAAQMQGKENILPWCFHLYFTTHLQKCVVSYYEKVTVNYACTNSQTPGTAYHLLIVQWISLGLNVRTCGKLLKILILGPHPEPCTLKSLWEEAQASIFLRFPRCCQLYSSVKHCLYQNFTLVQVLSVENLENCTVS